MVRARREAVAVPLLLGVLGCSPSGESKPEKHAEPTIRPATDRHAVEDPEFFFQPVSEAGRWRRFRTHRFDPELEPEQREMIARLEAIGCASGSIPVEETRAVTVHEKSRVFTGTNFYVSGHAPEALLMDMEGNVLHRWRADFEEIWPDYPVSRDHPMTGFWRRAHLFENGDVLVIWEGLGIARLDRNSRVVWGQPIRAHHDLEVLPGGEIQVLTREAHVVPEVDPREPILEDFVSVLDAEDGEERRRVSLLTALMRSEFADSVDWKGRSGDVFHTNTVSRLDGRNAHVDPAFAAGNALVYMLGIGTTAIVDLDEEKVVWAQQSDQIFKHDPQILENGNWLVFENHFGPEASAVLEIDTKSGDVVWQHGGEPGTFYSNTCGTAARLPNGNTLITESDGGRAFEIAPDGDVVWEFYNPHRAGEEGQFIATLFELVRIPPDFPLDWVAERS